jgi:hypothetical protein
MAAFWRASSTTFATRSAARVKGSLGVRASAGAGRRSAAASAAAAARRRPIPGE